MLDENIKVLSFKKHRILFVVVVVVVVGGVVVGVLLSNSFGCTAHVRSLFHVSRT